MKTLQGKNTLITGASRGIGLATALAFAKSGANIALNYFSKEEEASAAKALVEKEGVKCEIYKFDVSDFSASKEGVDKVMKDFGKVDILINNAGITKDKLVMMMSESDFDSVIDINLKGSFNMIKHLYQSFVKARAGSIVNISSIVGLMGGAGQANYSSAKAGVIGLTKSIARELGGRGITCNAIAPGYIETDMTKNLPDEIKQKYVSLIPLRRAGQAEEIAETAVFLAGASYITGEVVKVDGGLYI